MGTNFYWIKKQKWMNEYKSCKELPKVFDLDNDELDNYNPFIHIGKRSSAGHYCTKCGITYCRGGEREIHMGGYIWDDVCPACGSNDHKTFVCSFTWTMRRHEWEIRKLIANECEEKVIQDEYGEQFTAEEFLCDALENAIVTNQHFAEFS